MIKAISHSPAFQESKWYPFFENMISGGLVTAFQCWAYKGSRIASTPTFSIRITENVQQNPSWQTIQKACQFLPRFTEKKTSESFLSKKLFSLIEMIYAWLRISISKKDFLITQLESILQQGCCLGASQSLLNALKKNNNVEKAIQEISSDEILLIQLLHVLECYVSQQLKNIQNQNARHFTTHPMWQQGNTILSAIRNEIQKISGFSVAEPSATFSDLPNFIQYFKKHPDCRGLIRLKPCVGASHAIVIDVKNHAFFDINFGYYSFPDNESCLRFLACWLQNNYPYTQSIRFNPS